MCHVPQDYFMLKKKWEADPRKALCHKVCHTFTRASFLLSLWRRTKVDLLENIKQLRARRCAREIHVTSFLDSMCFPSCNWWPCSQQLLCHFSTSFFLFFLNLVFIFWKWVYSLHVFMYVCMDGWILCAHLVHKVYRRGCQMPCGCWNQTRVSHKSSRCSLPLNHFSSPHRSFQRCYTNCRSEPLL